MQPLYKCVRKAINKTGIRWQTPLSTKSIIQQPTMNNQIDTCLRAPRAQQRTATIEIDQVIVRVDC